jgi:hypothetical protein
MSESENAQDYYKGDPRSDAVEVHAVLKRPSRTGETDVVLRTTLIKAIPEMRVRGERDMPGNVRQASDLQFLVWDIHSNEMRDKLGIERFYLKYVKF